MTYSSGGLIEASDYNGFAGGNGGGANVSGQLNTVLATGYGNAGYGQTAVANVSVLGQVTAAQWTTLVNGVNTVRKHQSGGGFSNLSTYVAGTSINATNDVSSNTTSAYTNRLTSAAAGPTFNQPNQATIFSAPNDTSAQTFNLSRTATFGSSDQARYFFNAGGSITLIVSSITNTGGTFRGASLGNVIALTTTKSINASAATAITTPAPYTEVVDLTTNYGYYGQSGSNLTVYQVDGSAYGAAYSTQSAKVFTKVTGTAGSNGGLGEVITFSIQGFSPAQSPAEGDSINITVNHNLRVIYPSDTYLANTWGSVTFG